ncbi:DUF3558 family protein [Actinoplanes missouriensis]|uniref:DUF3558 family protein n=1 Tax=Actinoplanes missouriensis TaxID=1866 RepID=UPI0003164B09|nr:DUF3558 family protein [Actinoplanes missouriensis]
MPKRIGSYLVAGATVLLAAGCAGEEPAPTWQAAPAASAPASKAPPRAATITSACDLFPANQVTELLGGNGKTKLAAEELPAEKQENGNVWRHCAYGRDGKQAFVLSVATMPDRSETVDETIDAVAGAGQESQRIKGLGAGAVGYLEDTTRSVLAVVPYRKDLRVVQFTGPALVPQDKIADPVRRVLTRI